MIELKKMRKEAMTLPEKEDFLRRFVTSVRALYSFLMQEREDMCL
jgi:hypothetical protein